MYTILDSLKKVTPKQEPQENKKPQAIYESVEAKGSILEGVAKVEEKLKEQFAKFNEGDTEYKNGVTKHKGTYGTEYQGDPDDEDAPKRGRPAKGTARTEKVERVKGPKGRPKKDPAASAPAKIGNDPFGRVPDKAPKGAKGTVVKGKATQDTNEDQINELSPELLKKARDKAGEKWSAADDRKDKKASAKHNAQDDKFNSAWRKKQGMAEAENPFASFKKQAKGAGLLRSKIKTKTKTMESSQRMAKLLIEGVNFTEMIKKKDMTLQEMLAELQADIQSFKETGHCSELLRDCMEVHSYGKSQLNDATENPMDNDNFPMPLAPARPSMMDRAKRFGGKVLDTLGHGSDEDMKADLRRKMGMQEAAELNELARLAGLTVKEGNDGNLANNAKPYKTVTRRDVIQGAQGKDEQGGEAEVDEAAKYRDPKYKDRLYTQEPRDPEDDYYDLDYYTGAKPDDYAGSKDLIGGGEFDHNDPLQKGFGRHGHDVLDRGPRKGMPSRNHITSLKGSIKAAHGTHSGPNLPEGDESQSQPAVRIINDFDEVVDQFDTVPKGFRDALRSSEFDAVQWLADIMKKDPDFDITTIEKIVLRPGVYGPDEHVIDVTEYLDHLDEGAEASGFYVNYEIRTGDPERVAGPFASQQEAQAWINDNVPNPSDEPYYNISQVGFNEDDMEEGAGVMHFKALQAKADGKDSFRLGDEEFPVQEGETCPTCKSEPCACEDTEAADQELAKLKENCGIVSPIGSMAQDMQQQQGKMSINTNQSSDGTKNISISADGEAADQLMQILKMAGMAGGQQQHAEVVVTAEPMEAKEYGNTNIDKPEEVLNTPRPDVRGMHRAETVGYADTTDDLNKQKDQDPKTANRAANPKTPKANRVEESHPLESLGAKLMAEYQSIKLTK
jgi:hypothetical protein